jgi:general secretion pathway protein H
VFQKKAKYYEHGFTLFELIIAMAVVGLMVGMVISQANNWFDINIKSTTNKLSSTVRYLHDKASTQNLYIRLIFDFEKNSYWVEATSEQFMLTTKEIRAEIEDELAGMDDEEEEVVVSESEEGEEETITLVKRFRAPEFGAVDEFLLKPVKLPDGVFLKDIYTSHDDGPISAGQAFIYFFPNGYIEPAIINLKDTDDELNFSIEINPITGSTYLRDVYKAMEDQGKR